MKTGTELIAQERQRQISQEGWTPEHDDGHDQGQLGRAATSYIWHSRAQLHANEHQGGRLVASPPNGWPFEDTAFKPSADPIRDLVKAGALIAAEIDRLQRQQPPCDNAHDGEMLNWLEKNSEKIHESYSIEGFSWWSDEHKHWKHAPTLRAAISAAMQSK